MLEHVRGDYGCADILVPEQHLSCSDTVSVLKHMHDNRVPNFWHAAR